MKTLKTFLVSLLTIVIFLSIVSCSKDDYSSPLKGKTFSDLIFESSMSSKSINLGDDNVSGLSVIASDSWCVASVSGNNINISVQANNTYGERQTTIIVTDSGDNTSVSFKVTQQQNDAIMLDGSTYTIPESGGEVSIKVQSNVQYTVEIPENNSWLTYTPLSSTRALESSTLVFSATKNDSGDEREASVRLKDATSGTTSQFTVKQGLTPSVEILNNEFILDEFGGEIQISVNSNTPLNIQYSDDWISNIEIKETGSFSFIQKIKVHPMSGKTSKRLGAITYTDKAGKWNITKNVPIIQNKSLLISEPPTEIYVGETVELKLNNNIGKAVVWGSSNSTVASVNNKGIVTGVGIGETTITVKTEDEKYSDAIIINVVDVSSKLSCQWSVSSIQIGGWKQSSIGCSIINNSKYSIVLTKCTIYKNGAYLNSTTDSSLLGEVAAGASKGLSISNVTNATSLSFIWEYTFMGKTYTYRCDAPSNVL